MAVPVGAIAIWSGTIASIPANWNLCDGTSGTPDLRDKFVRGAPAATEAGGTGGATNHNHTEQAAGAHTHPSSDTGAHAHTTASAGDHNHGLVHNVIAGGGSVAVSTGTTQGAHTHTVNNSATHNHTLDSQGSHNHTVNAASDSRPPYYDILFIQATASAAVDVGLIIIWSGLRAAIPTGWLEKTELREKYARGASNGANGGGTGGSANHNHTTANCSGHTHGSDSQGDHNHTFNTYSVNHNHTNASQSTTATSSAAQRALNHNFAHTHANSNSIGTHTHTFQSGGVHNHGNTGNTASNPAYQDVMFIKNDSATNIPQGGILIWVGLLNAIPTQYDLCDGSSPRPDLRAVFIRGVAAGSEAGGTGGSDTHTHTDGQAGIHNDHTQNTFSTAHQHANTNNIGHHVHTTTTRTSGLLADSSNDNDTGNHNHAFTNDTWSHTHTASNNASNHNHTIDNGDTKPPYYHVQFIYRTTANTAWTRIVTEKLGALESKTKFKSAVVNVSDKLGGSESKTKFKTAVVTVTEKLGGEESWFRIKHIYRTYIEKLGGIDRAQGIIKIFRKFKKKFHEHPKQKVIKS